MLPIQIHCTRKSSNVKRSKVDLAGIKALIAGKRCLVLDDEFLIALDIQQMLEAAGAASVTCFGNAADALAALRDGVHYDLAVLDVKLSGATRTSMTVAETLHASSTPFVFLTGICGDDIHTREFPGVPVIEKPYERHIFTDAIRRALDLS
jgi:CheY-like chemotaxis protein